MDRRDLYSFGIPVLGLVLTVSELIRLSGVPDADPLMYVFAVGLGLVFAGRLVYLAIPRLRKR